MSATDSTLATGAGAPAAALRTSHATVPAIPRITSFSPTSGRIGTTVVITGQDFNAQPSNNVVHFGAARATVLSGGTGSLTVQVPVGATYEPILVTDPATRRAGASRNPFSVTFSTSATLDRTSFATPVSLSPGSMPNYVFLRDVDADGRSDLIVGLWGGGQLCVFRNVSSSGSLSAGSFSGPLSQPGGTFHHSVAVEDVSGDGLPDVVTANYQVNTLSVLVNTSTPGAISFALAVNLTALDRPNGVIITDIDGDGQADIVLGRSDVFSIYRNTSSASFVSFADPVDVPGGAYVYKVSAGDFDGDGRTDLASANFNGNSLSVVRNQSTEGSISFGSKIDLPMGTNPDGVLVADLNGDGRPDLVGSNRGSGVSTVFANTSQPGNVSFGGKTDLGGLSSPGPLAVGDLDGDGMPEIAVGSRYDNRTIVYPNLSTTSSMFFGAGVEIVSNGGSHGIAIGDIDGDGLPDVASVDLTNSAIRVQRSIMPSVGSPPNLQAIAGNGYVHLAWGRMPTGSVNRYRIYGGTTQLPTTVIDSTTGGIDDTTRVLSGLQNGIRYYFRVTAVDPAGVESGFSNVASAIPLLAAPEQLEGVAGDASVTLRWRPVDDPGVLGYRIYQGTTSPASVLVDTSLNGRLDSTRTIAGLVNGTSYFFRVAAVDALRGNGAFSNEVFVVPVDLTTTPGQISPANGAAGLSTAPTLAWTSVAGATGYHVQVLVGSTSGVVAFEDTVAAGTTSLSVGPLANSASYVWRVRCLTTSGTGPFSGVWAFSTQLHLTVQMDRPLEFPADPTLSTSYRLVSLPGVLMAVAPASFLSGTPPRDWRLVRDEGGSSNYLTDLQADSELRTGEGYWLLKRGNLTISRQTTMPLLQSDGTFSIGLHSGWNIIGNPFERPISWAAVRATNGLSTAVIYDYRGPSGYVFADTIHPFRGYYFDNGTLGLTTLRMPYPFVGTGGRAPIEHEYAWRAQVSLVTRDNEDRENFFAVSPMASEAVDDLDLREPPSFSDQGSAYFLRSGDQANSYRLTQDVRERLGEGQVWELEVQNPQRGGARLEFRGIDRIPLAYEVVLRPVDGAGRVDLRSTHSVELPSARTVVRYRIVVGTESFLEREAASAVPTSTVLHRNYPNPFNPTTNIAVDLHRDANVELAVFSLLGQRLATLVARELSAGRHVFQWDGMSDGSPVAAGVYLVRLAVNGTPIDAQKMVLTR